MPVVCSIVMSKTRDSEDEFAEYRTTSGAETKTVDISSDDNPLKQAIGEDDSSKERKYDASLSGERFVQFYENTAAGLREYIANAETACIRRARYELREDGIDDSRIPDDVRDLLSLASVEVGYEPQVEITYREQGDASTLVIEDNGIGISTHEYQVVQRVGYSTSHMNGEDVGNFGVGWLSGFLFTGVNGCFKQYTKSRKTDESYATLEYVSNFEYLDAMKESYGTRFVFPEFSAEMKEINVAESVGEYASGLRVPLVYREFDASGAETDASEEYAPRRIEDKYSDESFMIVYEDEYFKAVMSPESSSNQIETFNVSMPIRRNASTSVSAAALNARWKHDYVGKREDGPIVHCPSKPSIEGMKAITMPKYESLNRGEKSNYMPVSRVPDDAIMMAEPASSRDSFKSNDEFWKYVSSCVQEKWRQRTSEILSQTNSWSDFTDLDSSDRVCVLKAYNEFIESYSRTSPSKVQSRVEDAFNVSLSEEYCAKLDRSQNSVMVIPEDHNNPRLKKPAKRNKMQIQEVLGEYSDGVYMAKSPSKKKCDIAWGLGDTAIIRLPSGTAYEKYTDLGFEKLKSLPNTNLEESLPELDDSVIEKYDSSNNDSSNDTVKSSYSAEGRNPETKRVKIRVGGGNTKYMSLHKTCNVTSRLDAGDEIYAGKYSVSSLIVYDQTKLHSTPPSTYKRDAGIGVVAVSKYVYEYLEEQAYDNIYFTKDNAYAEHRAREKQSITGTNPGNPDVIVFVNDKIKNDDSITIRSLINEHTSERVEQDETIITHGLNVRENISFYDVDYNARMISINCGYVDRMIRNKFNHTKVSVDFVDLRLEREIPDADLDSEYFNQVFNVSRKSYLSRDDSRLEKGIKIVKEMGGTFPDQYTQ